MLDDTCFNLLVFGQSAGEGASPFGGMVRVLAIPHTPDNNQEFARAGISQPSFYLLRPDGHVGLCGPQFDAAAVARYLADRAHVVTDAAKARAA